MRFVSAFIQFTYNAAAAVKREVRMYEYFELKKKLIKTELKWRVVETVCVGGCATPCFSAL